jgi:hypothetical protein
LSEDRYSIDESAAPDMSPAQRAVVQSIIDNRERVQWFLEALVPRNKALELQMKLMGRKRADMWKFVAERLGSMRPDSFDTLLIELNHYTQKGLSARSSEEETAADATSNAGTR